MNPTDTTLASLRVLKIKDGVQDGRQFCLTNKFGKQRALILTFMDFRGLLIHTIEIRKKVEILKIAPKMAVINFLRPIWPINAIKSILLLTFYVFLSV